MSEKLKTSPLLCSHLVSSHLLRSRLLCSALLSSGLLCSALLSSALLSFPPQAFAVVTEKLKTATPEERKKLQGSRVAGAAGSLGVFESKYIGSVPCKESRGNEVVTKGLRSVLHPGTPPWHSALVLTYD